jgi:hypothetical protein
MEEKSPEPGFIIPHSSFIILFVGLVNPRRPDYTFHGCSPALKGRE